MEVERWWRCAKKVTGQIRPVNFYLVHGTTIWPSQWWYECRLRIPQSRSPVAGGCSDHDSIHPSGAIDMGVEKLHQCHDCEINMNFFPSYLMFSSYWETFSTTRWAKCHGSCKDCACQRFLKICPRGSLVLSHQCPPQQMAYVIHTVHDWQEASFFQVIFDHGGQALASRTRG
jgi:hypothetical protein